MDDKLIKGYHKIDGLYKRYGHPGWEEVPEGKERGSFVMGEWATPEFEYLQKNIWIWTEKLDGTNIRIGVDPENAEMEFRGRTDKAVIPKPLAAWLGEFVSTRDLLGQFPDGATLYCEGVGEKIQKGGLFGEQHCKLLDVNVGGWWLEKCAVKEIAESLRLDHAPVAFYGSIHDAIALTKCQPKSAFGEFAVEGYVGQPLIRLFDSRRARICAKVKVRDFLND